jgi:hypothetical protein
VPGYLENYGAGEEKRDKLLKRAGLIFLFALLSAGLGWYFLHNYQEDGRVSQFVELLKKKDYPTAYAMWGCTVAQPCRDYNYERFLEDWGGKGTHADASAIQVEKTRSCKGGVIRKLKYPRDEVLIFVSRGDLQLTYPPWGDACEVRLKSPASSVN